MYLKRFFRTTPVTKLLQKNKTVAYQEKSLIFLLCTTTTKLVFFFSIGIEQPHIRFLSRSQSHFRIEADSILSLYRPLSHAALQPFETCW